MKVPEGGLEPPRLIQPTDFKSESASFLIENHLESFGYITQKLPIDCI